MDTPRPSPRTNRTRRVPHPVLIGHAACPAAPLIEQVLSEEWAKAEKKGSDTAACAECGGTGRLQGGLGVLPGLQWWPIKAFRPCPTCEAAGRTYNRRGQGLDEVRCPNPPSY